MQKRAYYKATTAYYLVVGTTLNAIVMHCSIVLYTCKKRVVGTIELLQIKKS